jgi:hypothetical protein
MELVGMELVGMELVAWSSWRGARGVEFRRHIAIAEEASRVWRLWHGARGRRIAELVRPVAWRGDAFVAGFAGRLGYEQR